MASTPAVLLANHFQFGPGEVVAHGPVSSRLHLWCRSGEGEVIVNGRAVALRPDLALQTPWWYRIEYRSSRRHPLLVSAIHVVPGFAEHRRVRDARVHHDGTLPEDYQGDGSEHLPVRSLVLRDHPLLAHLLEFVLLAWLRGDAAEASCRDWGRVLLAEWCRALSVAPAAEPEVIARARLYLHHHRSERVSCSALARACGVSPATLTRVVQRHCGTAPAAWARRLRLEHAQELLRTTRLPLEAIAAKTGFSDAFHLARVCRRLHGETPSGYRRRHALL